MTTKIGYEILVKVSGFEDAKRWIYRMVQAGIVKCSMCDQAATHIFWQDRAEWYPHCEGHRDYGQMWTGSTGWKPRVFSIGVLKDAAIKWRDALAPEERKRTRYHEYDATNYYALKLPGGKYNRYYLQGDATTWFKRYVNVYPLTTGQFAYQLYQEWSSDVTGTCYGYGLVGAFDSEQAALDAAKLKGE